MIQQISTKYLSFIYTVYGSGAKTIMPDAQGCRHEQAAQGGSQDQIFRGVDRHQRLRGVDRHQRLRG